MAHRVGEQLKLQRMRLMNQFAKDEWPTRRYLNYKLYNFCKASNAKLPKLNWNLSLSETQIHALLEGELSFMGVEWRWEYNKNCWHIAPDTGRQWPVCFFSSIPYRQGNPFGDVRIAWEPSRLQHLLSLALVAQYKDENSKLATLVLEGQLESWMSDNPPLVGIHYISAMECGLRILALCHALDIVRSRLNKPEKTWPYLLCLVEQHANFILTRLSLHSSTGNHTIAEAAGLIYAGVLFPEFSRATEWKSVGLKLLEKEADHQILKDGGGVEQSFWYHAFVVDLYVLVGELLQNFKLEVPARIINATERGINFLSTLSESRESLPNVGDNDNGYALSPHFNPLRQLQNTSKELQTFRSSGYSLAQRNLSHLKVLFDHGSLGMAPSHGHGHADALSMLAWWKKKPVFIDPGTYSYTGDLAWRSYFRGTRAHNTVCVDQQDQAKQEGPFLWSKPYSAQLLEHYISDSEYSLLLASHDGYKDLGVVHYRAVVIFNQAVMVWDYVFGSGEHELSLNWHLGCPALAINNVIELKNGNDKLSMEVSGGSLNIYYGEKEAGLGWFSPMYGEKVPVTSLEIATKTQLPHEFFTVLNCGEYKLEKLLVQKIMKDLRELLAELA